MTRLPPALQPLWPLAKQVHRRSARALGAVTRRTPLGGDLPREASLTSRATAARFGDHARYHSAGAPIALRRQMPAGTPPHHWVFAGALDHDVPERYVLDLDGGSVIGPHVGVATRDGVLDQETSHYFGLADWREHPIYLNPRRTEPEHFDGTLAVLAGRAGHNFFHFVMDALPRLGILATALPDVRPDAYFVDGETGWHRQLLELLGLDTMPLLHPRRGLAVRAERLLVPSLPNNSSIASPETTAWLREHLPPKETTGLPERLYITRGTTKRTRRMDHEDAVVEMLARHGFVRFDPGTVSVQEQIDHFAAARVIVAPHGAALTNLNFCRPGVRVLELFAADYINPAYWSIVENIEDTTYRYLVASGPKPARPHDRMIGMMHDIPITPDELEASLEELLGES